ncbi:MULTISPECIES: ketosteroid isomerase family protein [unclassified Mycobacterium]|uniref:ketosteroid isomerase family protein n=1 Tax=unclassified Mycobacterium TaxID=2642494 RepID=UPI0029C845F1|nr:MULTISPECIES: ketosteroid isomerase family protein [unclassified Mycobacterium]
MPVAKYDHSRAELLAVVEQSPAAAGAHDRAGWVGLFTADGTVEDPVGSRPHRAAAALSRFYDTFIGPRDIVFHRDTDIVTGATVIRDLELEVTMASSLVMRIPTYLRYDVDASGDQLKIARLQAYWELPAMVLQFARGGRAVVPAGMSLSRALLANQGIGGTIGFLSGFRGVRGRGKRHVVRLLSAACTGNELAARRLLASALVTLGDDSRLGTSDLMSRLTGARWRKVIASGGSVAATIERGSQRSVLIAELGRPTEISRIRIFADD